MGPRDMEPDEFEGFKEHLREQDIMDVVAYDHLIDQLVNSPVYRDDLPLKIQKQLIEEYLADIDNI